MAWRFAQLQQIQLLLQSPVYYRNFQQIRGGYSINNHDQIKGKEAGKKKTLLWAISAIASVPTPRQTNVQRDEEGEEGFCFLRFKCRESLWDLLGCTNNLGNWRAPKELQVCSNMIYLNFLTLSQPPEQLIRSSVCTV